VGSYWETYRKPDFNPKRGKAVMAERRRVKIDYNLPMKDAYGEFVLQWLAQAAAEND
jgi:tRNA(His) guanylyltransferase